MKTKLLIPIIALSAIAISTSALFFSNGSYSKLAAGTGIEREGKIVLDSSSYIDILDDDNYPYNVYAELSSNTLSGYIFDFNKNI